MYLSCVDYVGVHLTEKDMNYTYKGDQVSARINLNKKQLDVLAMYKEWKYL